MGHPIPFTADRIIGSIKEWSIQKWSAVQNDDLTVVLCDYVG